MGSSYYWINRLLLLGSLLAAVLLGLPHMPWRQLKKNEIKGGANIDWMPEKYLKYTRDHPLPPIQRFPTRNGDELAIRIYKAPAATTTSTRRNVVLHHGGAVDSTSVHPLAVGLQKRGVDVYVPDVRGHGESVNTSAGPGNLDYRWQNLDDLEDLLTYFDLPPAITAFAGHSAQGGAAWYLASLEKWRTRFAAFVSIGGMVALEPELVKEECFSNYIQFHIPRINALMILNALGITAFNKQSIARGFRKPTNDIEEYTWEYSYSMMVSHTPTILLNYKTLLSRIPNGTRILAVYAGADEAFKDPTLVLKPLCPSVTQVTIPGAVHMGILFDETLADAVAEFVKAQPVSAAEVD